MECGFYPGSFDPPTLGHRDIIVRGLRLFKRLVVGIGVHPSKAPMFSEAERAEMLKEECSTIEGGDRCETVFFGGLTVDAARAHGADCIIRGLRDPSDFSYEIQLSSMNSILAPDLETIFVAASPQSAYITATLVRQIATFGGDVSHFVSPSVLRRIKEKVGAA